MNNWMTSGTVWHRRQRTRDHAFTYPVTCLCFPLAHLADLEKTPLLSVNRAGLFSFHEADHGPRDGTPLLTWIHGVLADNGLACADGDIRLQTMPRVLGRAFNPISFWFCHDRAGRLRAVLCEVNNTFGGHHHYLVAHPDGRPIRATDTLHADKVLHVSPFFRPRGRYRFRFDVTDTASHVRIDYHDDDGPALRTAVHTRHRALSGPALITALLAPPWPSLSVWPRIHLQALRLWLKGVPFHGKFPQGDHR